MSGDRADLNTPPSASPQIGREAVEISSVLADRDHVLEIVCLVC